MEVGVVLDQVIKLPLVGVADDWREARRECDCERLERSE